MSHRLTVLCVEKTSLFSGSEVGGVKSISRNAAGVPLATSIGINSQGQEAHPREDQ